MDDRKTAFGRRKQRSLSRPVTPSEIAFAAFEPLDSKPAAPPVSTTHSPVAGLLLRARQVSRQVTRQVSWIYPRVAGLAIATVLSFALTTAIFLARAPEYKPAATGSNASETAAADPVQTAQAESLGGIRFVDPPAEMLGSCENAAWPYIDQRCFAGAKGENDAKKEAKKDVKSNGKIGPRPIDSELPPNPLADAPIGSMTAIIPANPKLSTTDGVATPADAAEPNAAAGRAYKSVRASDAAERTGLKKKKIRRMADARRLPGDPAARGAPETPSPFVFPFGLFSQAR